MNDLPRHPTAEIGAVEDRFFTLRNFLLTGGTVMPWATIAYETYGRLEPPMDQMAAATPSCARTATPAATILPDATGKRQPAGLVGRLDRAG